MTTIVNMQLLNFRCQCFCKSLNLLKKKEYCLKQHPQPELTDVTNVCWDLGRVIRQRKCVAHTSVLSAVCADSQQRR